MKKISAIAVVVFLVVSLMVVNTALAGSYTLSTTAEQDVQLETIATVEGVTVQDLINVKFLEHLNAALESLKRERIHAIRMAIDADPSKLDAVEAVLE